jgi:hypothetical protein
MLPLLPALILLLLQGPSNFERLAIGARLPEALEAIHRQMSEPGSSVLTSSDEQALADLIATKSGAELTQALISFLCGRPEIVRERQDLAAFVHAGSFPEQSPPPTSDGFARCQRSRDGPRSSTP